MSRWTEKIAEKTFKGWLNALKAESGNLPDQTRQDHSNEIARIRKAIDYIGNLLPSVEAELIPFHLLNGINISAQQCHEFIGHYLKNPILEHLENANTKIDEILACIVPYALIGQNKSSAAVQAFMDHIGSKTKQIEILHGNAGELIKKIQLINSKYQKIDEKIDGIKVSIQTFEQKALQSAGGENSLEAKLEKFHAQSHQKHNQIEAYRKQLTEGDNSIVSQVSKAGKDILAKLSEVNEKVDALRDFHEKVFGKEQEDGSMEGGLRLEIEKRLSDLETYRISMEQTHAKLKKDIEDSLPGATAAGLAEAYRELKESSQKAVKAYTTIFCSALVGIFVLGIFFVSMSESSAIDGNITIAAWFREDILKKVLLFGAPIWLAFFSGKRRSEARRLEEEYAHKESFVKFYVGFKKQIEALEEGKEGKEETLMKQLIEAAIKAISLNASATLDKKHGENTPIQEIVEEAIKKAKGGGRS